MGPGPNAGAAGAAIAGVLCCLIVAIPLGLAIGSVILRAGVSVANKILGAKPGTSRRRDRDRDDDDEGGYEEDRYGRRDRYGDRDRYDRDDSGEVEPIPEPSLGWGMLIVLAAGIVNGIIGFIIALGVFGVMQPNTPEKEKAAELIANLISMPVGFLSLAGFSSLMLPTTFPRGMLVAAMYYVIAIAVALVIGAIAVAVIFAIGGLK
mgnify:CR=1 FL=1